jgi:hypothetical protein
VNVCFWINSWVVTFTALSMGRLEVSHKTKFITGEIPCPFAVAQRVRFRPPVGNMVGVTVRFDRDDIGTFLFCTLCIVLVVLSLGDSAQKADLWWRLSLVGDDAEALRRKLSEVHHKMAEIQKEKTGIGNVIVTVSHPPWEHGAGYPYNDYTSEERQLSDPDRYKALERKYARLKVRASRLQSKLDSPSHKG